MKIAVFHVSERNGVARLVCAPMPSLRAAAIFEAWLRMHADMATEIKFLGRFDSVHAASSQQEAETLILKDGDQPSDMMMVHLKFAVP